MRNIYPNLMIKMVSGNKKIYIRISALCIGICAHMHATFLEVEIADSWFLSQAGYHFVVDKESPKQFFLSTFEGNVDLL